MLPVTHGVPFTRLQILLYTLMLLMVTLLPFLGHMAGPIYLAGALVLGLRFVYFALRLWLTQGDTYAMPTFLYSIRYLMWLFGFLLVDHYAPAIL